MSAGEHPCSLLLRIPDDVDLSIPLDEICERCEGTGNDPKERRVLTISVPSSQADVHIAVPERCSKCKGSGWTATKNGRVVAEFIRRHMRFV